MEARSRRSKYRYPDIGPNNFCEQDRTALSPEVVRQAALCPSRRVTLATHPVTHPPLPHLNTVQDDVVPHDTCSRRRIGGRTDSCRRHHRFRIVSAFQTPNAFHATVTDGTRSTAALLSWWAHPPTVYPASCRFSPAWYDNSMTRCMSMNPGRGVCPLAGISRLRVVCVPALHASNSLVLFCPTRLDSRGHTDHTSSIRCSLCLRQLPPGSLQVPQSRSPHTVQLTSS